MKNDERVELERMLYELETTAGDILSLLTRSGTPHLNDADLAAVVESTQRTRFTLLQCSNKAASYDTTRAA